jgi:hypothetical protein
MSSVSIPSSVKTYVLFKLLKNKTFDTNNFSTISSFYGDGMIPTIDSHFISSYAWLWYDRENHLITIDDEIIINPRIVIRNDISVFEIDDEEFMVMDEHAFNNFFDIQIEYMDIEEEVELIF